MNWDEIRLWGLYVVFGLQLIVQFIGWLARRNLATPEQLAALKDEIRTERGRIHDVVGQLRLLEQKVSQMPDHEDIARLGERIGVVDRTTARLETQVDGLEKTTTSIDVAVQRIEQHLLDMKRAA